MENILNNTQKLQPVSEPYYWHNFLTELLQIVQSMESMIK